MSLACVVWSACRTKRKAVVVPKSEDALEIFIQKASKKLEMNGSVVVLESNGTLVDETELLFHFQSQILMLLAPGEYWAPGSDQREKNTQARDHTEPLDTSASLPLGSPNFPEAEEIRFLTTDDPVVPTSQSEPATLHQSDPLKQPNISQQPATSTQTDPSQLPVTSLKTDPLQQRSTSQPHRNHGCQNVRSEIIRMWSNYQLPWTKVDSLALRLLESGQSSKFITKTVIETMVSEVRLLKPDPPAQVFDIIAEKIVESFPDVFQDRDDAGRVYRNGYMGIAKKLKERNNYLVRPHMKASLAPLLGSAHRRGNRIQTLRAGTLEWQPIGKGETAESLEERRMKLCAAVELNSHLNIQECEQDKENLDPEVKEVLINLHLTYGLQRKFLNQTKPRKNSVLDVANSWPILLNRSVLFWHFSILTNHSINELRAEFLRTERKIFVLGLVMRKLSKTIPSDLQELHLEVLKTIAKTFNEDHGQMFPEFDSGTEFQDIEVPLASFYPCVVVMDETYILLVDGTPTCSTQDVLEAVEILIASYFVLNRTYPKEYACTLEFLQNYMLQIQPQFESRSPQPKNTLKKVHTFVMRLKNFQCEDYITNIDL